MKMIELMRAGKSQQIIDEMPEFCEQAIAETDGGALIPASIGHGHS